MPIAAAVRRMVEKRAESRCEYCHLRQEQLQFVRLHIEHIIARQHGGTDDPANLALCCHWCNYFKGTNIATLIREKLTPLYHPRRDKWEEHFVVYESIITGITAVGEGTVRLLHMNDDERVQIRSA